MGKWRIDPSTRVVIEAPSSVPDVVRPSSSLPSSCVELCVRSAFSGLAVGGVVEGGCYADAARAWPGANTPEEIVERAASHGYDVVAVTDLDTLAGVVRAATRGRELGVRCIVGVELWLPDGPLVLHVQNQQGYSNLCAILTIAREGLEKGEINHRLKDVVAHADGLYALVVPPFVSRRLAALKEAFGDRLSVAVYRHRTPEDTPRLRWAQRARDQLGIPLLATSRAFLADRYDKRLHDVLCCIRQGLRLSQAGQRLMPNDDAVLSSPAEMQRLFRDLPEALARSREVADACTFQLQDLHYSFPAEAPTEVDGVMEGPNERLRRLTWAGAEGRYHGHISADARAQLQKELTFIEELELAPYFLTVHDIVAIAREKKILCQGRGSAANSAVCYCLGITAIDPVQMGLLFERFLSKERNEPPDIDVDFEHERREEVIQAIYERWGRHHAAMVAEVIAFRGRSAVREVGKVFGLTETVTGAINGLMAHASLNTVLKELGEVGVDLDDAAVAQTLSYARRLQGHPRHLGIHVGGFILTSEPMHTIAPVEPARMEKRTVLPWDKDDVEELGFFKMDVLGLGMLTCIRKGLDLLAEHEGRRLELHTIPQEDPVVYDALCRGDSVGIFQVESRAQMAMLPRLRPRTFYDLVVQVAIVRPGPIQGGMVHPYLRRRTGEEAITYPHPSLEPILQRTLGVPLFQEQVMRLAMTGAGYSAGEADQLRRDMAAWKKTGRLERHHDRLMRGFAEHGIPREFADRLFEQIKGFGEYGFPESHAASFAVLVYASAWLKTYHPGIFATALLNSLPMGFYAPSQIVADAQAHGVTVLPVDVNASSWDCTLHRDGPRESVGAREPLTMRLGLRQVKSVGEDMGRAMVAERERHGRFVDVNDASFRCGFNLKVQRALARGGAFDSITPHRRSAVWNSLVKRPPLLARLPDDEVTAVLPPPSAQEILMMDYAQVGLSIGDHPMRHLRPGLAERLREGRFPGAPWLRRGTKDTPAGRGETLLSAKEVGNARNNSVGIVAGLVIGRQRPGTADGTCFVTLEDETGNLNIVIWGRDFERWRRVVVTSSFMLIRGRIERQGIVLHVIALDVAPINPDLSTSSTSKTETHDDEKAREQLAFPFPFQARSFH